MISLHFRSWCASSQSSTQKLVSNARLASSKYDPNLEWVTLLAGHPRSSPLKAKSEAFQSIGNREAQEDAYFIHHDETFVLAGVFDGHRGSGVSTYASSRFQTLFGGPYESTDAIDYAFQKAMAELQNELLQNRTLASQGSTAVVSYLDLRHELIYTAALGDSEAMLLSKKSGQLIPLSLIRNWTSRNDSERYIKAVMGDPELRKASTPYFDTEGEYRRFLSSTDAPKEVRLGGLNVSRTLGNGDLKGMSAEPKMTVSTLHKGDRVWLFSDGVTDQIPIDELQIMCKTTSRKVVRYATAKFPADSDNVTAVAIKILEGDHD